LITDGRCGRIDGPKDAAAHVSDPETENQMETGLHRPLGFLLHDGSSCRHTGAEADIY
jgi:hypothetical protein